MCFPRGLKPISLALSSSLVVYNVKLLTVFTVTDERYSVRSRVVPNPAHPAGLLSSWLMHISVGEDDGKSKRPNRSYS